MNAYLINRWDILKNVLLTQYRQLNIEDVRGEANQVLPRIAKKLNITTEQLIDKLQYLNARTI